MIIIYLIFLILNFNYAHNVATNITLLCSVGFVLFISCYKYIAATQRKKYEMIYTYFSITCGNNSPILSLAVGNVLSNSATHHNLLPLWVGGKKEERTCSEWEAAYSSGKGANEVQRL